MTLYRSLFENKISILYLSDGVRVANRLFRGRAGRVLAVHPSPRSMTYANNLFVDRDTLTGIGRDK